MKEPLHSHLRENKMEKGQKKGGGGYQKTQAGALPERMRVSIASC